jgi:uncharacterized membrane protein
MWCRILLLVHIVAGMAWVGGGFLIHVTEQRAFRRGGRPAVDRVRADLAWADTWLALPAPLLVVGSGIVMVFVSSGWRFAQTWIWASLALIGLYEALALTVGARLYGQLENAEADLLAGTDPMGSFLRLGSVLIVLLLGVVVLMVFKPGMG